MVVSYSAKHLSLCRQFGFCCVTEKRNGGLVRVAATAFSIEIMKLLALVVILPRKAAHYCV